MLPLTARASSCCAWVLAAGAAFGLPDCWKLAPLPALLLLLLLLLVVLLLVNLVWELGWGLEARSLATSEKSLEYSIHPVDCETEVSSDCAASAGCAEDGGVWSLRGRPLRLGRIAASKPPVIPEFCKSSKGVLLLALRWRWRESAAFSIAVLFEAIASSCWGLGVSLLLLVAQQQAGRALCSTASRVEGDAWAHPPVGEAKCHC